MTAVKVHKRGFSLPFYSMRLQAFLFVLACVPSTLAAQQSFRFEHSFEWNERPIVESIAEGFTRSFLYFDGATLSDQHNYLPVLHHRFPVGEFTNFEAKVVSWQGEPLEEGHLVDDKYVSTAPTVEAVLSIEKKQPSAHVTVLPIVRTAPGFYQRVTSITYEITAVPSREYMRGQRSRTYVSTSVLGSGNWYKFKVDRSGVFKLDYAFLKDKLGLDPAGIDPRNIRIYGNGGGMLPELGGTSRHDDLVENAIIVAGESDGNFDQGDFVQFYAQGPTRVYAAEEMVDSNPVTLHRHQLHLYDDFAYYFLTVDLGPGKRIGSQNSSGSANYTSTAYDYYTFHENDQYNPSESGRQWLGEAFNPANLTRTFDFTIPNLVSGEPVYITSLIAARSLSGSTAFNVRANGQQLYNQSFNTVGGNYYDTFARQSRTINSITGLGSPIQVQMNFTPSGADPESTGWLDYITINARRNLVISGGQTSFRDLRSVGAGRVTEFRVSGNGLQIWEVTNPVDVRAVQTNQQGQQFVFTLPTEELREFIVFDGSNFYTPEAIGKVPNQNIHGTIGQPDVVIVTHNALKSAADRLADFHTQTNGYDVAVITIDNIYNEFSSGAKDITAVRDLMKMLYDKAANPSQMPRYLILFGDGTYDYKNNQIPEENNTHFVPTYQSFETLGRSETYTSDDFFGLLDDNEGVKIETGGQLLDIGVGRIVATDLTQANAIIDKIFLYHKEVSYRSWRNVVTFIGDDEDGGVHLRQADSAAKILENDYPVYNKDKIYIDAYEQVSTPGGNRYPQVNTAINSRIFSGTLIMNYTGHGGENGWAHERILTFDDIGTWNNKHRLPLLVTATCSFSPFDNPNRRSAGEVIHQKADGGAIGLISTVRLVYSHPNDVLVRSFFNHVFKPINGEMPTLGELLVNTKNTVSLGANSRKFLLLGDPAMKLGYPEHRVVSTAIDTAAFSGIGDTLKALAKVTIHGEVRNTLGQLVSNFDGIVYPTIYDKRVVITTLRNDPGSPLETFTLQKNIIYRGKASVIGGKFQYTFIVPKDIAYNFGLGKISYYANMGTVDAHGFDTITIGGSADSTIFYDGDPEVKLYMNDEKFVFGGLTDENPVLLAKLYAPGGINTAGSAIGHDITGILDEEDNNLFILNDFYEAALDDFTRGEVRYPLYRLKTGRHNIRVKAWDVYNKSAEGYTEFVVAESAEMALSHVLNYPNPFTTNTAFWFEHNRPGQKLIVTIRIFTVTGKVVKTLQQEIISEGYRVDSMAWDGLDEYGDEIGKGVYVYRVSVRGEDGSQADAFEKLVLLR